MGRFDGVAVVVCHGRWGRSYTETVEALGEPGAAIETGDGQVFPVHWIPGAPYQARTDSGQVCYGFALTPGPKPAPRQVVSVPQGLQVAVVPPVEVAGWRPLQPLPRRRWIHLVTEEPQTACGRLRVGEAGPSLAAVDCPECLTAPEVRARMSAQLEHVNALVEVVGRVVAAGMARLWPRMAHIEPRRVPLLMDGMLFAIEAGLPGAPDEVHTLRTVAQGRAVASATVMSWARRRAKARMRHEVAAIVRNSTGQELDGDAAEALRFLQALVSPVEVASLLVEALEDHGPSPTFEGVVLESLDSVPGPLPDGLADWQLIHRTARALGGSTR